MPALAPLTLTFYDLETMDACGSFISNFVPLKYLKLAIRISRSPARVNDDTLSGLIVDLFGRQFNSDELSRHHQELWQRAAIGVAAVSADGGVLDRLLHEIIAVVEREDRLSVLDYQIRIE